VLSWAALAAALLLMPAARPAQVRADILARRGRLRRNAEPPIASAVAVPNAVWFGACVAAAVAIGMAGGFAVAAAALVALTTAVLLAGSAGRRRRRDRETEQLLSAVSVMAAEMEAGASPTTAVLAGAEVSPGHGPALRALAGRVEAGAEPNEAAPDADLAALEHAWRVAATTGAPLADVWSRVARDLTQQIEQRRAVASALAGARSSAALLAGLPVVGVLLGTAMQAQPLHVLAATSAGHVMLLLGVCLDAAGLGWTHWLTARAEAP
jgi:tight adherence protein B